MIIVQMKVLESTLGGTMAHVVFGDSFHVHYLQCYAFVRTKGGVTLEPVVVDSLVVSRVPV
jgi:hypothetical protein